MRQTILIQACLQCPFLGQEPDNTVINYSCKFYNKQMSEDDITKESKPEFCKMNEVVGDDHYTDYRSREHEMDCRICHRTKKDCVNLEIYAWGSEGVWACLDCRKLLGSLIRELSGFIMDANKHAYIKFRKK